jgi:RNA-directed DNA polymerase
VNAGAPWMTPDEAKSRVLHHQRKLHRWATADKDKRFHDLWNLVCDPATIQVAWARVRANQGSRTAGVDAWTRRNRAHHIGEDRFLIELRDALKSRSFRPLPVRERGIPKKRGTVRCLGIPALRDRVVQMALKLVLEPIFESGCAPRGAVSPEGGERPLRPTVAAGGQKLRAARTWRCRSWAGAALTT